MELVSLEIEFASFEIEFPLFEIEFASWSRICFFWNWICFLKLNLLLLKLNLLFLKLSLLLEIEFCFFWIWICLFRKVICFIQNCFIQNLSKINTIYFVDFDFDILALGFGYCWHTRIFQGTWHSEGLHLEVIYTFICFQLQEACSKNRKESKTVEVSLQAIFLPSWDQGTEFGYIL
jgi:hypothetical protein